MAQSAATDADSMAYAMPSPLNGLTIPPCIANQQAAQAGSAGSG